MAERWFAIANFNGHLITGAFARRNQAIAFHVYNCAADEIQPRHPWGLSRLDADQAALWKKRRKEGFRVVPVAVAALKKSQR